VTDRFHPFLVAALAAFALVSGGFAGEPDAGRPAVEIDRAALPVAVDDPAGVERRLYRDGRVYIAGQPTAEALARFRELGVTAVVNLRGQSEMDQRESVPFDERAELEKLGIEYVHLPIAGDEQPWRPAVVDELAAVLERHRGPVLLHCTVAWRASYVWTAYLVRHLGLPLAEAVRRGEAIGMSPDPLATLLDRPVERAFADEPPAD
jgi:uncharacterized protein (TIGR01244 family)